MDTLFQIPIVDLQRQSKLIRKISSSKTMSICYVPENPCETFSNICIYFLNNIPTKNEKEIRTKVFGTFKLFNFDFLFGEYNGKYQCWEDYAKNNFENFLGKQKIRHKKNTTLLQFKKQIIDIIPEEEMIIPSFKQKVKPIEIAFILKCITDAVIKNHKKYNKKFAILYRKYFMKNPILKPFLEKEEYKKLTMKEKQEYKKRNIYQNYYEKTCRKLNNHKLPVIYDLLYKYNFIIVERRKNKEMKNLPNKFWLGENNYTYSWINKGEQK